MAGGGPRVGAPGASYTNRSDLQTGPRQPIKAASGQGYGERKAQEDAQKQIPLPGSLGDFHRPTERPDEPLTAGMAGGAGPGPEALTAVTQTDDALEMLRALYRAKPYEDLRRLIERVERSGA